MNVRSAIAKATALLVYLMKKEQEEESVFQSASGKLEDVFATSIESVDIKSVICGRINCNEELYGGAPDPSDSVLVM